MKKVLALVPIVAGALLAANPASAAVTIDFETTGAGTRTAIGSSVGADYSSLGATFSNAFFRLCGGGCPAPVDGRFVSGSTFSSPFSVMFAGTTDAFSFQNVSSSSGTASAFDTNGNLLQLIPFSTYPMMFSFSVTGINSVTFNGPSYGVDNFTFADVRPTGAVPEPSTWAMMLLGFGAIGSSMRRRRRPTRQLALI